MAIKKDYLVEKRNVLNEIRANGMSLQELRLFSIYLSKINPRDTSTRVVRFSFADFQKIMNFGSRVKIDYLKHVTNSLLCKVVSVPTERGGYDSFQLFKRCRVDVDENDHWYVEIDAHDESLPLMFEFKERYFTYELWNALRLKSSNQLRMYEILKQYEKTGERIISIDELKALLGIEEKDYSRFGDFKVNVLDVCQKALHESTDINFTCEPYGKKGRGGKILELKFQIERNNSYVDQMSFEEFINQQDVITGTTESADNDDKSAHFEREIYPYMAGACNNEFTVPEIQVLYNLIRPKIPYQDWNKDQLKIYDYLKRKYGELQWRASKAKIKNRMAYLKKIIAVD